jgi:hypothetical protein
MNAIKELTKKKIALNKHLRFLKNQIRLATNIEGNIETLVTTKEFLSPVYTWNAKLILTMPERKSGSIK